MHLTSGLRELREPGPALATAVELRLLAQQMQDLAVRRARDQGWSWEQIAAALGTSRKHLRATYHRSTAGRG
jgi:transcriptional regulator